MATAEPLTPGAAHRILARAAYGARPGEAAALARQGLDGLGRAQLTLPAEEPAIEDRIDEIRIPIRYAPARAGNAPMSGPAGDPAAEPGRAVGGPTSAPAAAPRRRSGIAGGWSYLVTLLRKVAAAAQLRERMVEFWPDHFNVAFSAGHRSLSP